MLIEAVQPMLVPAAVAEPVLRVAAHKLDTPAAPPVSPVVAPAAPPAPAPLDREQIRAAVILALEASMIAIIENVTDKVVLALDGARDGQSSKARD